MANAVRNMVRQPMTPRLACLIVLLATPASATTIDLAADPVPTTTVALKRGTVPVRVSLGFDRAMLLNLAPAKATGLKPFPIIGKFKLKNPQLPGGEAIIRGNIITADVGGTGRQKLPTAWIDKDVVDPPAQGVVSVMAFKADYVRISVAGAPAGGRQYELNRAGEGDSDSRWKVGGDTVRVVIDLTSEVSVMNARAARALEAEGLVRRTGKVALWSPVPALLLPVELMKPVPGATALGGLPLIRPVARITPEQARTLDAQTAAGMRGESEDDEDAIVVTADSGKAPRGRVAWMLIGRDVLQHCQEILLDRPARRWRLSCAFPETAS